MRLPAITVLVLAFLAGACTTPSRTYDFAPNASGARAAGERMLAQPPGSWAEMRVEMRRPEIPGPHVWFFDLNRVRPEQFADPAHAANHQLCSRSGEAPGCTPQFEAVFIRHTHGGPRFTHFTPDILGAVEAQARLRADSSSPRGYLVIRIDPVELSSDRYVWRWEHVVRQNIQADFVCGFDTASGCVHRLDVRKVAIVPRNIFASDYDDPGYRADPGFDLVLAYDRANIIAEQVDGRVVFEVKSRVQEHFRHGGGVYDVTELTEDEICGRMNLTQRPGPAGPVCLQLADIERFTVRDQMRNAAQIGVDAALTPFRFLGAVVGTTVAASAGH